MKAHRAFRQLARQLARTGLDVLRFDYSGTGNSWGDGADGTLSQWVLDIVGASDELRATTGVRAVSLLGFRLGGTLALQTTAKVPGVDGLLLWDPVVDGERYLAEVLGRRPELQQPTHCDPSRFGECSVLSLEGFALSDACLDEIRSIRSEGLPEARVRRAAVLATSLQPAEIDDLRTIANDTVEMEMLGAPGARAWEAVGGFDSAVVDSVALESLTRWFETQ
jgi:pimeloyl-ACP methyl ester carboxylesterase